MGIQVHGVDALVSSLDQAATELRDLSATDHEAATLVEQASVPFIPRKTGRLAASSTVAAGTIGNTASYAVPVFAGWRRGNAVVAARPWVDEGAKRAEGDVVALYEERIDTILGKVHT